MNQPLLPAAVPSATGAVPPVAAIAPTAAAAPVASGVPAVVVPPATGVAPAQPAAPVAPAQPAVPAAPATPALSVSAQAQQALRLQVFQTLIAQLVTQVQSSNPATAPQWPTSGVPTALREMLSTLIAQATAGLPQPQQLAAVQHWPQTWLNTVLAANAPTAAAADTAAPPAVAGNAAPGVATQAAGVSTPATLAAPGVTTPGVSTPGVSTPGTVASTVAPRLPPMQTWLVQQGVVQAPDGERGFALTLQVPQAWAQLQAMPVPLATPAGQPPAAHALPQLQLPLATPAQQLESGALALVLQNAGPGGERLRTSALLWLDFQPLPVAAQGAPSAAALASLLPGSPLAQQLGTLQPRNDPWLQMAALQASGQRPREDQRIDERRTGLCDEPGCPYHGKASCAQPFCADMNRVWAAVRLGPTAG